MDGESWFITLSTAIGGFLGWQNAVQTVKEDCTFETFEWPGELLCLTITNDLIPRAEYSSWIYPSSILTGLAFGLLAGALLVGAWKLLQSQKA